MLGGFMSRREDSGCIRKKKNVQLIVLQLIARFISFATLCGS
jgi:hypothetical protein